MEPVQWGVAARWVRLLSGHSTAQCTPWARPVSVVHPQLVSPHLQALSDWTYRSLTGSVSPENLSNADSVPASCLDYYRLHTNVEDSTLPLCTIMLGPDHVAQGAHSPGEETFIH
jgi:hypothetical protein